MDSPRSEKIQTRFSTPVSELDDHRNLPVASSPAIQSEAPKSEAALSRGLPKLDVPYAEPQTARSDPGLLNATSGDYCLSPLSVHSRGASHGGLSRPGVPIARDFYEEAIIDDDKSGKEPFPGSSDEPEELGRTRKLSRTAYTPNRSRNSSRSSSSSRPNSVNAFADQRARGRSNTFGSVASPELELKLTRTHSNDTHRRRPTICGHNNYPTVISRPDTPSEGEKFFENENVRQESHIDYEAIEEFVAENERGRQIKEGQRRFSETTQVEDAKSENNITISTTKHAASVRNSIEIDAGLIEKAAPAKGQKHRDLFERRQSITDPPRFAFFSSQMETTMHVAELAHLVMDGESFKDIFELPEDTGAWWLDVVNPSPEELEMFREAFSIHPLTKEDIEEKEDREKVELFNNYYFVNFKTFDNDKESEDYLEGINIYMVVFREGILTFSYSPTPHAAGVRKKISRLRNYESLTADWICYAMVDHIVDFFFPVMRSIENETEQIEDQVFTARADDAASILRQIGDCRKRIMCLMRLLGGKADVIKGFAKRCNAQYTVTPRHEIGLYLSDIQDHIVTMMSNLGHFEKMLSRSHSNYLAQLSVDNLVSGNRANDVLSKITVIATIIVPMNLVCGLFGMNVPVPGNPDGGSLAWFGGILGFLGFIVVFSLLLARYFRYI